MKKRVIGMGGVFFKSKNPQEVKAWYEKHLGIKNEEHGTVFGFRDLDDPEKKAQMVWSPFKDSTKYFEPSEKPFMFNYRVENLEELIKVLKEEGVQVVGELQVYDYGKFAHIMDCDGNKVELWEPIGEF